MTREEVEAKSHDLMAPVTGAARSRKLCEAFWNLEGIKDVRTLRPLLRAPSTLALSRRERGLFLEKP
jgi:hypothetical protein